jgi:hypothetical protein
MIKYLVKEIRDLNESIDHFYKELLEKKYQFIILKNNNKYYCLTKEQSLLEINNIDTFITNARDDKYYHTIKENICEINFKDLERYYSYIDLFKDKLSNKIYGERYLFGTIAIKSNKGFITTTRGKENLNDYAYVNYVDHTNNIVSVKDKKASLNAPLLATLFENENVEIIVHINHEYDDTLQYFDYSFPGTIKDSKRDNTKSFNIKNHGVFYLFNKKGDLIK